METLLTFGVGVDTSAAEAGLASLGGSAEGVAAGLEDRLASASDGMKDLGKQSSQASRGIQGLASVVSLVDPRLGQVIRSVGTLTRGLSVLRLGMGPAAVAVAAVTAALALYQRQQAQAAEEERKSQAISDAMRESRERLKESTIDLDEELRGLTSTERNLNTIRRQAFVENLPAVQEFTKQIAEQSRAVAAAEDQLLTHNNAMRGVGIRYEEGSILAQNLAAETHLHAENVKEAGLAYQDEQAKMQALQDKYSEFLDNIRQTLANREKEIRIADQRTRQHREEAASVGELADAQRDYYRAIQEVEDIERAALNATMTERERVLAGLREQLDTLNAIAAREGVNTGAAELAVKMQAAQQLDELDQRQHEQKMARIEREQEAQRHAAQEQIRIATDLAGTSSQLVAMGFKDKQAAMVAEGTTAAILAGINTIASNPTPLGIAQAGLNVALAMAQVAQMRSVQPSFHRGGFGDEYSATMRRGEAVLSPQGRQMMGDDAIRRANRGQAPQEGGGVIEVRQFYRHRPFDEFARDNLERGGPVTSAINGSRQGRSYHRSNRNGA